MGCSVLVGVHFFNIFAESRTVYIAKEDFVCLIHCLTLPDHKGSN